MSPLATLLGRGRFFAGPRTRYSLTKGRESWEKARERATQFASYVYGSSHVALATLTRRKRRAHHFYSCQPPAPRVATLASLLLGVITALVVVAVPAAAQAATPSKDTLQANGAHHAVPAARLSSFCSKVSASAVSAIVGYKVPAGVFGTFKIKPAKENYETSGTDTTCTYGAETSMATIVKSVTLSFEPSPRRSHQPKCNNRSQGKCDHQVQIQHLLRTWCACVLLQRERSGHHGSGNLRRGDWYDVHRSDRRVQELFKVDNRLTREARRKALSQSLTR